MSENTGVLKTFKPADLIYAATQRCRCGAGLAYPRYAEPFGPTANWDCSAILTGTARTDVVHEDSLPFAFHKIKSEQQPSGNGASTRPPEDTQAKIDREYEEALQAYQNANAMIKRNTAERVRLEREKADLIRKRYEAEAALRLAELRKHKGVE